MMARQWLNIPPAPIRDAWGNHAWIRWIQNLQSLLTNAAGLLAWSAVSKVGSNLNEIATRMHNDLQAIQGGTSGERYHLTAAELTELQREDNVIQTAVDYAILATDHTVVVTATSKTITLPAASAANIGKEWEVVFATSGTCTVQTQVGDSFPAPSSATESTAIMTQRGQSLVFRCKTATTWVIV